MANVKPPLSVREEGLQNHLGLERYTELDKRLKLDEPISVIARALGLSRPTIYHYKKLWSEQNSL